MSKRPAPPMRALLQRLARLGVPRKYIREFVLPQWWDDEAATTPAGLSELHMILAQNLGIALATLRDPEASLRIVETASSKLKLTQGTAAEEVAITRTIAAQVARLAEVGARAMPAWHPRAAADIRGEILSAGRPWVDLEGLLRWCWDNGIPVLHVATFPPKLKKMHGLAAVVRGRPVLVVCKNQKQPSWLLFILAHELAHVALGHVADNQTLLDQDVNGVDDAEEKEANAFAIELLCGEKGRHYRASDRWLNAAQLADAAREHGRRDQIDPGHIVLNYAHSMGREFFPTANAALKLLYPAADGPALIHGQMVANLDWSALPGDTSRFVMRLTGAGRGSLA